MGRLAQASSGAESSLPGSNWPRLIAGLLCCAALSACGGKAAGIDPGLTTSSVAASADPTRSSDEMTIRNAVSSADPSGLGSQPLPWANVETGSRGAITGLSEYSQDGTTCRRFTATRESYDGVAMFKGETCNAGSGLWRMHSLQPL